MIYFLKFFLEDLYWLVLAFVFAAILFFVPRLSKGVELEFEDAIAEDNFDIVYGIEAQLFLLKNHIPLSYDFERYVKQNSLKIFSCYVLWENGKIITVTIKYIRARLDNDEEKIENCFDFPSPPHVVAEYKIDFPLAISWWKIEDLWGSVYAGKEAHFVY